MNETNVIGGSVEVRRRPCHYGRAGRPGGANRGHEDRVFGGTECRTVV